MNFILVWVLVPSSTYPNSFLIYSAPMLTKNECIKFKAQVDEVKSVLIKNQCVQITMGVAK